jgi:hypothetical protein
MTWAQRQELMDILYWTKLPAASPMESMVRLCVRAFLDGKDAAKEIQALGIEPFTAERAAAKARVFIGNERAKRRSRAREILEARYGKTEEFTHENFRVTMDFSQPRDFGMVNVSIYCLVEVWLDDDTVEKEYLVNYSDFKTKEWLTRLCVWALMNKREILLKAATEHEMGTMKMFVPKDRVA